MFIDPTPGERRSFSPQALVLHTPGLEADPEEDRTRTGTFIVLHPSRSEVLIGGTFYAGEIKKSIFTVMNDRLPLEGVLPMHCSANVGTNGRVAIFFGLSGTGKTTLSRRARRRALCSFPPGSGASLAGRETGAPEPQPTFSTCFGAPFLPQPPAVYAEMLGAKLDEHAATVWLVNTGWTGGPFGEGQ